MLFLRNNPELNTARDAVTYRGFAKSNVSTAVGELRGKGWLTVEPDLSSRRIKRLVLRSERDGDLKRLGNRRDEVFQMFAMDLNRQKLTSSVHSCPGWMKML